VQRRHLVDAVGCDYACSVLQQQLHELRVTILGGQVQRRVATLNDAYAAGDGQMTPLSAQAGVAGKFVQ
jgi:hypothetical protein